MASATCAHAEGEGTEASADASHSEGYYTVASGFAGHAEGYETEASAFAASAGGYYTLADQPYQTVIGMYNLTEQEGVLFSIGNGNSVDDRSDAFTVSETGDAVLAGNLEFAGINLQDTIASLNDRITALEAAIESLMNGMDAPSND